MTRFLTVLLLFAFTVPLSGCGIKSGLKTAPPLWGEKTDRDEVAEAEAAEEQELETEVNPLDVDEIGYGVDVAGTP